MYSHLLGGINKANETLQPSFTLRNSGIYSRLLTKEHCTPSGHLLTGFNKIDTEDLTIRSVTPENAR